MPWPPWAWLLGWLAFCALVIAALAVAAARAPYDTDLWPDTGPSDRREER